MADPNVLAKHHEYMAALHKILHNAHTNGVRPQALVEALAVEFLVRPAAPSITDVEDAAAAAPPPPDYARKRSGSAPQRRKQ